MHSQGRKLSIANNYTVCESCDSYGHFAKNCPHCKPNAVAAQNKRDATWAEKNSVQASELQEINKLIKEAERLYAMADTASIISVVSNVEDWGSKDHSRAAKDAAVKHSRSSLSSLSRDIPSPSVFKSLNRKPLLLIFFLLAATVAHSCVSQTHANIVTHKKVCFPIVLSSAPRLDPHKDCFFLSWWCSTCNSFKNSKRLWLVYSQTTASRQQRTGCKCDACRKFYTLSCHEWNEMSASHSLSRSQLTKQISAAPVVHNITHTVQPTPTLYKSRDIDLISSSATFLDTPFGMAMRSLPHNDSVVYLRKGECHIAQHQTECMLGLTERGEMDKTGNSYYAFGDWASPNQHVDMREKAGNTVNMTCPFGDFTLCHQPHVKRYVKSWHQILRHTALRCCTGNQGQTRSRWHFYGDSSSLAGLPRIFDHDDETHVPDFLSTKRVERRMQQRFELMCRNRKEAIIIHRAHSHPNNRTLLLDLREHPGGDDVLGRVKSDETLERECINYEVSIKWSSKRGTCRRTLILSVILLDRWNFEFHVLVHLTHLKTPPPEEWRELV